MNIEHISEELNLLVSTKNGIRKELANKGIIISEDVPFNEYPNIINTAPPTGGGYRLGYKLSPVKRVIIYCNSNQGTVNISWEDPYNRTSLDEFDIGIWAGTLVLRKENSAPENIHDGIVVVDSKTRDQYKYPNYYTDIIESFDINKTYYYGIFPYTTKNVYTYEYVTALKYDEESLGDYDLKSVYAGSWW